MNERMRPSGFVRVIASFSLLYTLLSPANTGGGVGVAAPQVSGAGAVVFAVQKYDESGVTIDPVVVFRRNGFAPPPGGNSNDGTPGAQRAEQQFIKDFYRPNRQLRLLFGGGEVGALKVLKYEEPGCVGMEASVTLETRAKIGGQVRALATDSATLGRGSGTRRAPTPEERASALEHARKIFRQKRVAPRLVAKMETDNLTAVDLDADGRHELVGSFMIMGEFGVEHAVFLVAEPRGNAHVAALSWYHHGREADSHYRRLVDVLDFEGDGASEIVVQGIYYESHDYLIYKKQRGAWRVVYTGGGGGC